MDIVGQLDAEKMKQGFSTVCFPEGPVYVLYGDASPEFDRLRQQNAELLKSLTNLYESCRWEKVCPTIDAAKDAIAKATRGE